MAQTAQYNGTLRDTLSTLWGGTNALINSTVNVGVKTLDAVDKVASATNNTVAEVEIDSTESLYKKQELAKVNRVRLDAEIKVETAKIQKEADDLLASIAGA